MTITSLILIAVDLVAALVLSFGIYYPRHRRRDLVVAFLGVKRPRSSAAPMRVAALG